MMNLDLSLKGPVFKSGLQDVARILAAGADPNVPDELGETPIFEATANGSASEEPNPEPNLEVNID